MQIYILKTYRAIHFFFNSKKPKITLEKFWVKTHNKITRQIT